MRPIPSLRRALREPLRSAFRAEKLPPLALWLMAADGMSTYLRALVRTLTDNGRDRTKAKHIVAELVARMGRRRYAALQVQHPHLPAATDAHVAAVLRGLYPNSRRMRWMFGALDDPTPRHRQLLSTVRLTARLGPNARWDELATHLGELLLVSTRDLKALGVARGNQVIARMCYQAGIAYAEQFKDRYALPDNAESAIEVLRVGEYLFQVNPEHHSAADGKTGFIEGSACPWYTRPGWSQLHCGIFGQFQNGVASVFGMQYILTQTIPRHGGDRCRIDLVDISEPRGARRRA